MKNVVDTMPTGRTDLEIFLFENFGAYVDLSHDSTTLPLVVGAVAVVGAIKTFLF